MEASPACSAHATNGEDAWWLEHFLAAERVYFLYIEAVGQAEVCGHGETPVSFHTGGSKELHAPGDLMPLAPGRSAPHCRQVHPRGRSPRRSARRGVLRL